MQFFTCEKRQAGVEMKSAPWEYRTSKRGPCEHKYFYHSTQLYMTNNIQDKYLDHYKPQATIFMQRDKLSMKEIIEIIIIKKSNF